jgi:hypothetical protein
MASRSQAGTYSRLPVPCPSRFPLWYVFISSLRWDLRLEPDAQKARMHRFPAPIFLQQGAPEMDWEAEQRAGSDVTKS